MTRYRSVNKRSSHKPHEHGILSLLVPPSSVTSANIVLALPNLTQLLISRNEHQKGSHCLHRPAGQAVLPQLPHQTVSLAGSQLLTDLKRFTLLAYCTARLGSLHPTPAGERRGGREHQSREHQTLWGQTEFTSWASRSGWCCEP